MSAGHTIPAAVLFCCIAACSRTPLDTTDAWSTNDLAVVDSSSAADLVRPTDITAAIDLAAPPDLAAGDLAKVPDLAPPAWTPLSSGTTRHLYGVWVDQQTVFVVGEAGTILRSTDGGATWAAQASGTTADLEDVSGRSASDVFAIGRGGTILRWDGNAWSKLPQVTSEDLFGVAATTAEVLAVGDRGTVLRRDWNQTGFVAEAPGVTVRLTSVAIDSTRAVRVAVGDGGTILVSAGGGWMQVNGGAGQPDLHAVWGTNMPNYDRSHFVAVGELGTLAYWINSPKSPQPWPVVQVTGKPRLRGVWGRSNLDLSPYFWMVGDGGLIVQQHASGAWIVEGSGTTRDLYDIDQRFAVGVFGTIVRRN